MFDPQDKRILLQKLYRLFSIRQRSEREIRDYFRGQNQESKIRGRKKISDELIDNLIQLLIEQRLINDLEFAKAWVESRSRKKGIRVIRLELIQKGIDKEIIEAVVNSTDQVEIEKQTAQQLLEKKIEVWKDLPMQELKKKAYAYLLRRGFKYEVVRNTIEKQTDKR